MLAAARCFLPPAFFFACAALEVETDDDDGFEVDLYVVIGLEVDSVDEDVDFLVAALVC